MITGSPLPTTSLPKRLDQTSGTGFDGGQRVVVIAEAAEIAQALQHPLLSGPYGCVVVGTVAVDAVVARLPEDDILRVTREGQAEALVVTGTIPRQLLTALSEVAVLLACRLLSLAPYTAETPLTARLSTEGQQQFVEVAISSARGGYDWAKRIVDLLLGTLLFVAALPILLVAAIAVFMETGGSPFFGHVRIGRAGQRFRCWKLRTMFADAEDRLVRDPILFERYRSNDFKLPDDDDPRITRVGRVLRKTSLDELPQLWNVLIGEMSLVGPRPIVADELSHFRGQVLTLLSVAPGMTGAWAVNGRHHLAYPRRAAVELAYVQSRSMRVDLSILARTVGAVLDPGFGLEEPGNKFL
jgi:lipopolysaccharide/colanic/teichoic acid biosynthesis glycosyltransferase